MESDHISKIDASLSQLLRESAIQGDRQVTIFKKLDALGSHLEGQAAMLSSMATAAAVMEAKMGESINDRLDLWKVAQQHEQEIHIIKNEMSTFRGVATGVTSTSKMFWVVGVAIIAGVFSTIGLFVEVFKILNQLTTALSK